MKVEYGWFWAMIGTKNITQTPNLAFTRSH